MEQKTLSSFHRILINLFDSKLIIRGANKPDRLGPETIPLLISVDSHPIILPNSTGASKIDNQFLACYFWTQLKTLAWTVAFSQKLKSRVANGRRVAVN